MANTDAGAGTDPGKIDERVDALVKNIGREEVPGRMLELARKLQTAFDARKGNGR